MTPPAFVQIDWAGRPVRIEHRWIGAPEPGAPLWVFLHEGLGSVSMWRDFPDRLCAALGVRGLVWSRPGYGRSTPRAPDEHWNPDFMHRQALEVMPALLEALHVDPRRDRLVLFGHSDGGSIALLHAAHRPGEAAAVVALAPHIRVEAVSVSSIAATRDAYERTDLHQRLARHHDDPDSAFWGWNRIWLREDFRNWSIEDEIAAIRVPVLAVQGHDDAYGTMEQVHGIARRVRGAEVLGLAECGHSPHRDQPVALLEACRRFARQHGVAFPQSRGG